jgi:hypothetical protein
MWRSNRRWAAVLVLSAVVALGTAACGDDDDDSSSATTTPTPTVAPVVGSDVVSIDFVEHAYQVSGPLTAGGTLKLANKGTEFHMMGMTRLKPGKTLGDVQAALSQLGGPGGAPTTTVAGSTSTTARGATTTTTAGGATTTTAAAGATTTTRASGTTTTTVAGRDQDPFAAIGDDVGLPGTLLGPGEAVELLVPNLQPGTYALICFLPTEGEGTPHFAKGMVGELVVVAGAQPPVPNADATYKVAPGKAVEGPATLTAGRHTLKFEAAPGSQQLEPGIARLNAGATIGRLNTALDALFEGEGVPAKGSAAKLPGQVVFAGFDLHDVTTFYLTVDLKPGNYVILADDTDVPNKPATPKELINVKVS